MAPKPFIGYLHSFRGVAILAIMGAHAWSGLGFASGALERDPEYLWLYATTEALFHGTTLFFALISGILYSAVLRGLSWRRFFVNKLAHVVSPYVVVSVVLTALTWSEIEAWATAQNTPVDFPTVLLTNLLTGQAFMQLWYVPVLIVLFLLTPLLERLAQVRTGALLLVLAALPLVVSRTTFPDLLSVRTMVYFLGAYALGMWVGQRLDRVMDWVAVHRASLGAVFGATLVMNFVLFVWEYLPDGPVSLQQTVVYLNKISAALLILQLLRARGDQPSKLLNVFGTYAFGLYFLHLIAMWLLGQLLIDLSPPLQARQIAWAGVAVYVVAVAATLLLCMLVKRLFGRHARLLLGV